MLDLYFSAAQKSLSNMSINIYENKSVISKRIDGVVLTPSGQMTLLQLDEARVDILFLIDKIIICDCSLYRQTLSLIT